MFYKVMKLTQREALHAEHKELPDVKTADIPSFLQQFRNQVTILAELQSTIDGWVLCNVSDANKNDADAAFKRGRTLLSEAAQLIVHINGCAKKDKDGLNSFYCSIYYCFDYVDIYIHTHRAHVR